MRSYLSPADFFRKMKHKDDVSAVIINIAEYTPEQIDALEGSHFPQWIKDQLKELQKRGGKSAEIAANEIAEKMIAASRLST